MKITFELSDRDRIGTESLFWGNFALLITDPYGNELRLESSRKGLADLVFEIAARLTDVGQPLTDAEVNGI